MDILKDTGDENNGGKLLTDCDTKNLNRKIQDISEERSNILI